MIEPQCEQSRAFYVTEQFIKGDLDINGKMLIRTERRLMFTLFIICLGLHASWIGHSRIANQRDDVCQL